MSGSITPVIVGVGEVTNRVEDAADGREPLTLIVEALRAAADDAGPGQDLLSMVDSIDVVSVICWQYDDLPGQIGDAVGAAPTRTHHSDWGGNMPTLLLDRAAERIATGASRVCAIVGAEAIRAIELSLRAGGMPDWTPQPEGKAPPNPKDHVHPIAWDHGLRLPADVYPLYENGLRHKLGRSFADNQAWSARLWEGLSDLAVKNPMSWDRDPHSAAEIATASPTNRMVSYPYTKMMNARISVDQSAAVLVVAEDVADAFGIAADQRVHPVGGAGADDSDDFLSRVAYDRAPGMALSLEDAIAVAGLDLDAIDLLELYSCFPCVPKLALEVLGLHNDDRLISVTGGLTFFGGPGNDYMLHAVAAMVRQLRDGSGATALLYGNGGFLTKHHALVLSTDGDGYPTGGAARDAARQETIDVLTAPELAIEPVGAATIETYTAAYDRAGNAELGIVIGRLDSGERFVANTFDEDLAVLVDPNVDPVGRAGEVRRDQERNRFEFAD